MRVKISGLDPHQQYYIAMDIVPVDNKRYRYGGFQAEDVHVRRGDPSYCKAMLTAYKLAEGSVQLSFRFLLSNRDAEKKNQCCKCAELTGVLLELCVPLAHAVHVLWASTPSFAFADSACGTVILLSRVIPHHVTGNYFLLTHR